MYFVIDVLIKFVDSLCPNTFLLLYKGVKLRSESSSLWVVTLILMPQFLCISFSTLVGVYLNDLCSGHLWPFSFCAFIRIQIIGSRLLGFVSYTILRLYSLVLIKVEKWGKERIFFFMAYVPCFLQCLDSKSGLFYNFFLTLVFDPDVVISIGPRRL